MIGALQAELTTPELLERFQTTFTRAFKESNGGATEREHKALEKDLANAETRVRNVTAALAKTGFSAALAGQFAEEEKRAAEARTRLRQASATAPKLLPHPRRIESYVRNLLAVLETDQDAARALLARHMPPLCWLPTVPPTESPADSISRSASTTPAPPTRLGSGAPWSLR